MIESTITSNYLLLFLFQRNRLYLLPWLINNAFSIVFSIIVSLVILTVLSSNSKDFGVVIATFIVLFISMSKLEIVLSAFRFTGREQKQNRNKKNTEISYSINICVFVLLKTHLDFYIYTWVAIYSLYNLIRRSQPNNEYTSLIEDSGATGNPIYTRA